MTSVDPDRRLHDIYRMRDLSGRLLYIGVTNGGLRRFMEHAKDKTWWREVSTIDVEHVHCSRPVIESIEREAIRSEGPIYNVAHNRPVVAELPPPVVERRPLGGRHNDRGQQPDGLIAKLVAAGIDPDTGNHQAFKMAQESGIFASKAAVRIALDEMRTYRFAKPSDVYDSDIYDDERDVMLSRIAKFTDDEWATIDADGGLIKHDTMWSIAMRLGALDGDERIWVDGAATGIRMRPSMGGFPTKRRAALVYMLVVVAEKGGMFEHWTSDYLAARPLDWALDEMVEYAGADDHLALEIMGFEVVPR